MSGNQWTVLRAATLAALALPVATESDAANLVSHFEFEGGAANSVGAAPDGSIANTSGNAGIGAGKVGTGALTLGQGDYLDTTTGGLPNNTGLFGGTIAFWIKTASNLTNGDLSNKTLLGNLNQNDSMAMLWGTNGVGNLQFFPRAAAGGQYRRRLAPGGDIFTLERSWANGEWSHLALAWQVGVAGGDFVGKIYIDGVEIDTGGADFTLDTSDTVSPWEFPLTLGGRNNRGTVDQFLPGGMMIDDFRVYDGMLDADAIAVLAAVPEPTTAVVLALSLVGALGLRPQR